MSQLAAVDVRLFLLINRHWVSPVLDVVMTTVTTFRHWRLPLIAVLLLVLARGKTSTRLAILLAVLAVATSDQIVVHSFKPFFHRPRPFLSIPQARELVDAHDTAFPSAHAANTFAAGVFLALRFKRLRWWILLLPALVAYSRVYVGVHYPSDVIAGAAVGGLVGGGFAVADRAARLRLGRRGAQRNTSAAGNVSEQRP